jgi:hypothetical protein
MRKTLLYGLVVVCTVAAVRCARSADAPNAPTGVVGVTSALNPDGSNLKVTAPGSLSPAGGATVDTRRPTLSFSNATGRFQSVGLAYDLEVSSGGTVVYSRVVGESANTSSHTLDSDLNFATDYAWRVRGRLGNDFGPWSATATFRTFNQPGPPPPPPPPPGGGLPFPIPAECGGSGNPSNRLPCLAAVAALSAEWTLCRQGRGINCHRFARQAVFAMSRSDPNYRMILAAPGGNACNCSACGPSDGTMFREDTTVYGGNRVFDMIGGAGGPSPTLGWSEVPGPRAGDFPADAPLCVP